MTGDISPGRPGPTAPSTILIVEDDLGTAEVFKQILTMNGYGVCIAIDAESGLHEVQRTKPSAVLLDLHLPMGDGLEFLRQLRAGALFTGLPIAVVTGDYFVEEAVAHELKTLGAHVHFKPLWEDELLRVIRDLVVS